VSGALGVSWRNQALALKMPAAGPASDMAIFRRQRRDFHSRLDDKSTGEPD